VVGLPHPKWQERPLAAVVLRDGASATEHELREFSGSRFASWQVPDAFVFVKRFRERASANSRKIALREQFAGWKWKINRRRRGAVVAAAFEANSLRPVTPLMRTYSAVKSQVNNSPPHGLHANPSECAHAFSRRLLASVR